MVLQKLCQFIGKHMAIIVLAIATITLIKPQIGLWLETSWIGYLLMVVMFGMGLTLNLADFIFIVKHPKNLLIGGLAQFTIMPLLAFALGKFFGLESALLAGVVLVGACPGGTASNVITYLSKGDTALSIGMTSLNTLLAPVLTPLITYLFLRTSVDIDVITMFLSIIKVVILPICLGLIISHINSKYISEIADILPLISIAAISLIIMTVIAHNSQKILETGSIVFIVVLLHNILGFLAGFLVGKALKLPVSQKKALSIEIGMQNSGLATSLAVTSFPHLALATVPGALFSVCHNITGAILANILRKIK